MFTFIRYQRLAGFAAAAILCLLAIGCSPKAESENQTATNPAPTGPAFTLNGTVTFDWIPAQDVTEGGGDERLGYAAMTSKPARRIVVRAMSNGFVEGETTTDDNGNFSLPVPTGRPVQVYALAWLKASAYTADTTAPNKCSGGSWDVRVIDNTSGRAIWAAKKDPFYQADESGITLNAAHATTERISGPFAIADTIVAALELACEGKADIQFPQLFVNWSKNNTSDVSTRNVSTGAIGTSYYTSNGYGHELYILGKADVDTDEYDDHVIVHEFGHYLEAALFRSDSRGGFHTLGDILNPPLAFGEGYGNALSAMALNDPKYVDTNGLNQGAGFTIQVNSAPPSANDRGHYSERSVQYFLWSLWNNRDIGGGANSFDRIYNVMANYQRTTPSMTSLQSFAAYYNQQYGGTVASGESLKSLWEGLDMPYDSLCSGTCDASGAARTADPFDVDNDLGQYMGTGGAKQRSYEYSGTSGPFPADFWRLIRKIESGTTNTGTWHEMFYSDNTGYENRLGMIRWFYYTHPSNAAATNVTVRATKSSCSFDDTDLYVWNAGVQAGAPDEKATGTTAGCPQVTFVATPGVTYTLELRGFSELMSPTTPYDIVVSP